MCSNLAGRGRMYINIKVYEYNYISIYISAEPYELFNYVKGYIN